MERIFKPKIKELQIRKTMRCIHPAAPSKLQIFQKENHHWDRDSCIAGRFIHWWKAFGKKFFSSIKNIYLNVYVLWSRNFASGTRASGKNSQCNRTFLHQNINCSIISYVKSSNNLNAQQENSWMNYMEKFVTVWPSDCYWNKWKQLSQYLIYSLMKAQDKSNMYT